MKSILDRSFKYTTSVDTDVRKTFARHRREQARAKAAAEKERATHQVLTLQTKRAMGK